MDENRQGNGGRRRPDRSGITVTGVGSAAAVVDAVTVTVGIVVIKPDGGVAFEAATRTATAVLAILADVGVDSRSVRTADLTLGPQLEWRDGQELLLGYQAGQRLIVQLNGLAGLPRMLSDLALSGGEGVRIESVQLTPSNPDAALREARESAFGDARDKATQLAELAGRRLGELAWITELPGNGAGPGARALWGGAAAAKMPVATGDVAVSVSVSAHWEFAAADSR